MGLFNLNILFENAYTKMCMVDTTYQLRLTTHWAFTRKTEHISPIFRNKVSGAKKGSASCPGPK